MNVFPAIYTTLSPQGLVKGVLTQYDLGEIKQCRFWNRGLSDVYLVTTDKQDFILRISHHHWRSRTDIQFELELLDFLHRHHLPVAYPFKTKDRQLFVTINALEGDRYAAVFLYAPGQVALGDLNPTQSEILGRTLSKLHQTCLKFATQAPRHPLDLKYLLHNSLEIIAPYLHQRTKDLAYLKEAIAEIEQQLDSLPREAPYWSVCWGDPHSGNVHFTADDRATLFDFDQCGYGWRAFDLAKFLEISLRVGIDRKTREAFFSGYQEVQDLSEAELNSLQALTKAAHIWSWAININWSAIHDWSKLDDYYCTKRLQHLKRLSTQDWQLF
ncbi:homoserine kinase [Myxosarcina sp. GI1]|uniref:homoserine kinase n=1 Tax=Myxosarcina sp. GI1 TaxID=1541065 RepID=UPI000AACEE59|nr:phosphotransferase [Myxosarcina sp. GI1]